MTNTNPRFNVKGNAFEMASRPTFDAEVQQRMALVEWINSAVPNFCLSLKASDEELRASLLDDDLLSQILQRLKYSTSSEGDDSSPSKPVRRRKIQRFIAAMSNMGLPSFELIDLEKGSMRPVLDSLIALKEHTKKHFGSPDLITNDDRRPSFSAIKFQRQYSLLSPDSPTTLLHGGNKFQEVFQMKQGLYADLPATKISEMVKSSSLDNAPTQSLLSVINGILDESIEKKNSEMPQGVACLLRKVVQEIERRIATQGEHLRTQSSMFKAREEKYHSRIKVLEALAKGTSEESESERSKMDNKKKSENDSSKQKIEEKTRFIDKEDDKLKDKTNAEVLKLNMELEIAKRTYELRIHDLKSEAKQLQSELERKLRHLEKLVEDSKVKMKECELKWSKKEGIYEKLVNLQLLGLEDLRRSSVSIIQEVSTRQKMYLQEFNHLGLKLKSLTKSAQSYHDVLNENRKLYNELQDLKESLITLKFAERVCAVELGAAQNNKEGKDVKELIDQVASLKDAMSKEDEEAGKLLRDPTSPSSSIKQSPNTTSSRGGPITRIPRTSSTLTRVRRPGMLHKSVDSLSDGFDPGTQYVVEETESEGISRGGRRYKRLGGISMDDDLLHAGVGVGDGGGNDDRCSEVSVGIKSEGTSPGGRRYKRLGGISMDDYLLRAGVGDGGDDDDRCSEVSAGIKSEGTSPGGRRYKRLGGISMDDYLLRAGGSDGGDDDDRRSEVSVGINDSDRTLEAIVSPERPKSSKSYGKRREKLKTSSRHSLSRPPTGASRLSKVKTTIRAVLGMKKEDKIVNNPL